MSRITVLGAGGFIAGQLCHRLVSDGHSVIGVDIKSENEWWQIADGMFGINAGPHMDMRRPNNILTIDPPDEVYHLACAMGGRGWIDTHESACSMNAAMDMHVLDQCARAGVKRFFFASTACVYPTGHQYEGAPDETHRLSEWMTDIDGGVWQPDGVYGSAKLFTEVACRAFAKDYPMEVRVGRYHGVFGPQGSWDDGTEKAPAALMRKAIQSALDGKPMQCWGSGTARRSFLFVDDAVEATVRLMASDYAGPLNIGSEETVTIADLAHLCQDIAGATAPIHWVEGPVGPHSRSSDNTLVRQTLGWEPQVSLREGLERLHGWLRPMMVGDDA